MTSASEFTLGRMGEPSLAGGDVGTIATSINYADNADYVTSMQKIQGDEEWQEFWAGAMADPTADMIRSGLYVNISGD